MELYEFMPSGKKEIKGEKIYPTLSELSTVEMDPNALRGINEDRERSAQRVLELEGALGQTNHTLKMVEARMTSYEASSKNSSTNHPDGR